MNISDGAYRPGDSFLHRVDPRVKLMLLLGLIACLFSASTMQRLGLIMVLWFVVAGSTNNGLRDVWRIVKVLRWLFLFTLLAHLFFTPGRTMFGTSWLSYDGLLRGAMIDVQLLLAVLFSLLLAWTTRAEALAAGLTNSLAPLQRLKVPVREAGGLLLLVLHFFPHIQTEVKSLKEERQVESSGFVAGLKSWVAGVEPLLHRMFDHADELSHDLVAGKKEIGSVDDVSVTFDSLALFVSVCGVALMTLLWQV